MYGRARIAETVGMQCVDPQSIIIKTDDTKKVAKSTGPPCSSVGVTCRVGRGLISDSTLGLTEVVWVGPENGGIYVGSPSIAQTANGTVLTSHDFFGPGGTLNATVQVLSDDTGLVTRGSQWEYRGNVSGIYWASLFMGLQDDTYLLGASFGDVQVGTFGRSVVISKSTDWGRSFSRPSVLFAGTAINETGHKSYGCAPTPIVHAADGRFYRQFDGSQGINIILTKQPVTVETDLLSASSWIETTPAKWTPETMVPRDWRAPIMCRTGRDP
eukprot:COSAG05_NODE_6640_length_927_cov_0.934783_1_plen_270_part_01